MSKVRASSAVAVALIALAWATTAASQDPVPDKEACASAHEQAQVARKRGRLIEARAKLQLCAVDACPALARDDCRVWIVELDERLPTIVVYAKDTRGASTTAARCALDGAPLLERLDGAPVPVNPGAHVLKCEMDGAPAVEQAIAVVEGEKGRRVDVVFEPAKPEIVPVPSANATSVPIASASASIPPPPSPPALAYGFAGLAAVGLGSFAYFGITGLSDESKLRNTCKTTCNPSDVSAVTTKYHLADASLGVAIVAAGVAGWLYFTKTTPSGAPQTGARIGVQAMPGGGGARVEVRF